jgi:threonine dehydrogenase-like Zn-dependent dehydrogenase
MRAIVLEKFGGLDGLVYQEIPYPEPKAGHAVIEGKAFGINHAEMHTRRGEWAEAAKVIGIECVGPVKSCPGGEFAVGAKVAALMGGPGRTLNGSYAEYTRAPASNAAFIESDLPWAELAAISETYATAWTCLSRNLEIANGQTLVSAGQPLRSAKRPSTWPSMPARGSLSPRATSNASRCCKGWAPSAWNWRGRTFPSASPKPNASTRCSTWSATGPSSIRWPGCAGRMRVPRRRAGADPGL